MDQELEKYYENYFDLFATDGWKQFVEEISDIHSNYRIEDIKNESHLFRVKGEREQLFRVLRFETNIRSAYDQIVERSDDT